MSYLLNGLAPFIIRIVVKGKATEVQTIERVKAFVRVMGSTLRPNSILKRGTAPGGENWIFSAEKINSSYVGTAESLWLTSKELNVEELRRVCSAVTDDFIDLSVSRIESEEDFFLRTERLI